MVKSLTKNSIFYLIYNVLNVVFPFITGIYVARILLPSNIGQVETARNLAQYFVIFSFLGLPTYGLREISKARNNAIELNKLYSELLIINTISTSFFLVIYLIIIFTIPVYKSNIIYFLITGISIALNFMNNTWLFEGLEKFDYISIRNIIFKSLSLILLFVFVKNTNDYLSYALITVVGTAGNYILNIINSKKYVRFTLINLNLKRHMKSVIYLAIVNLAIEIYSLVDITMLGLMCKKEVVTYYSYGMKIQKIFLQIINTFTMVLVPRIALYYNEERFTDFNYLLTKTLSIILILSIPIIIGINFIGDPIITLIYGNNYIRSAKVLKILIFTILISPIGYLLGSRVLLVSSNEKKMIIAVSCGAICNVIGNIILIPRYQEIGAAFASVFSEIIVSTIYIIISHKYFKLDTDQLFTSILKILFANTLMSMFLMFFKVNKIYTIISIIGQIVISIICYFGILLLTKEKVVNEYYQKIHRRN